MDERWPETSKRVPREFAVRIEEFWLRYSFSPKQEGDRS